VSQRGTESTNATVPHGPIALLSSIHATLVEIRDDNRARSAAWVRTAAVLDGWLALASKHAVVLVRVAGVVFGCGLIALMCALLVAAAFVAWLAS
jgi:hypothetical protein